MKIVLITVLIVGMAMCTKGIGRIAANGEWTHPAAILGYVLGVIALVVAFAGIFHKKILFVTDEKQALVTLIAVIILKLIIGAVYAALQK